MKSAYNLITADETTTHTYLLGYFFEENAGTPAAARVELRNGSAAGDLVDVVILASDGYTNQSYAAPLHFPDGIHVEVASGSVQGAIYVQ